MVDQPISLVVVVAQSVGLSNVNNQDVDMRSFPHSETRYNFVDWSFERVLVDLQKGYGAKLNDEQEA